MLSDLLEAQKKMDSRAESLGLQALLGTNFSSGWQHSKKPLHIRLLERTAFGVTSCWHWIGKTNQFGYGRFSYHGRTQVAHRLSYEAFVGPIPKGLFLMHTCDNPSCINPDHLQVGTYADNRRDCLSKGRWKIKKIGFANGHNKVTPQVLEVIRKFRHHGLSYVKIAAKVGLSAMTIWHAHNTRFKENQ